MIGTTTNFCLVLLSSFLLSTPSALGQDCKCQPSENEQLQARVYALEQKVERLEKGQVDRESKKIGKLKKRQLKSLRKLLKNGCHEEYVPQLYIWEMPSPEAELGPEVVPQKI